MILNVVFQASEAVACTMLPASVGLALRRSFSDTVPIRISGRKKSANLLNVIELSDYSSDKSFISDNIGKIICVITKVIFQAFLFMKYSDTDLMFFHLGMRTARPRLTRRASGMTTATARWQVCSRVQGTGWLHPRPAAALVALHPSNPPRWRRRNPLDPKEGFIKFHKVLFSSYPFSSQFKNNNNIKII